MTKNVKVNYFDFFKLFSGGFYKAVMLLFIAFTSALEMKVAVDVWLASEVPYHVRSFDLPCIPHLI